MIGFLSTVGSVLVLAATASAQVSFDLQCYVPGECLDSQILDISFYNSSKACLKKCQQTDKCEWFTYYPDTKACASQSGCLRPEEADCDKCISGERDCPDIMCGVRGHCLGALEGIRIVANVSECQGLCDSVPQCMWSSYKEETKTCTLTHDCPFLDRKCKDCEASEKPCLKHGAYGFADMTKDGSELLATAGNVSSISPIGRSVVTQ